MEKNDNLKVIYKNIDELIPYKNNPRKNDNAVEYVKNSIKDFGFKVPVVISKDNIVVAGHTRLKASKELGINKIPCIIADDLTDEQIKAFRLADNKVSEFSEWDFDLLDEELKGLTGYNYSQFGFEDLEEIGNEFEDEAGNPYTDKISIPKYEPTGEKPDITELINTRKRNKLLINIEKSNVSDEEKNFLREAANRHVVFSYKDIAEYYAQSDKEMQELMEQSALVIIDYNRAIEDGYVKLSESLEEIVEGEQDD